MKANLLNLATLVFNTPHYILPAKAEVIVNVLSKRLGIADDIDLGAIDDVPLPEASRFSGKVDYQGAGRGMMKVDGNVGIISIVGTLVNRGAWIGANSGMTSYEGLSAQIDTAINDPQVKAVILDINSPGGEATGMAAVASKVQALRAVKPVVAVVNDMAASAAYGIASAADEIVVSETSITGSIGVVLLHTDHSDELKSQGVKPTLIFAGAHKVDGNPFGPLSETVRGDMQASVNTFYEKFLNTVAAGRGDRLDASKARATEARTFIGDKAIAAGLADRVASFNDVLSELQSAPTSGRQPSVKRTTMSGKKEGNAAAENADNQVDAEAVRAEGFKAGGEAEKARITAIMNCEEATGREATAKTLALDTAMTADDAKKVLASTPKVAAPAAAAPAPTIAQRAAGLPEAGRDGEPTPAGAAQGAAGWGKAVAKVNSRVGK